MANDIEKKNEMLIKIREYRLWCLKRIIKEIFNETWITQTIEINGIRAEKTKDGSFDCWEINIPDD